MIHTHTMADAPRTTASLPATYQSAGFTLVELAVVVVLISILMTMGLGVLNAQLLSIAHTDTKQRQEIVKNALIAYMGTRRQLPCPDDPENAIDGKEDRSSGTCTADFGILPYAELGLSRQIAEDGWGNYMSYAVTKSSAPCPGSIDWTRKTCFGAGKPGSFTVKDRDVDESNIVAVIISFGQNGLGAYTRQNARNVLPPTEACEEHLNAKREAAAGCMLPPSPLTTFFRGERADNDDVIAYLGASQLIQAASIKPAESQATEDLAAIREEVIGEILARGCNYAKPSRATVAAYRDTDPWGEKYRLIDNIDDIERSGGDYVIDLRVTSPFAICLYSTGPNRKILDASCNATDEAIAIGVSRSSLYTYLTKADWPNC